jgi:cyanophycinase
MAPHGKKPAGRAAPGLLLAIGGAEDRVEERTILRYFLDAAGGAKSRILVLATASDRAETGELYTDLFKELRAGQVEVLKVATREEALEAEGAVHDLLDRATALFMTGGNQIRLSSILGGTPLAEAIRRRHAAGLVVAGTSAGASILSTHMIALGEGGGTPRRRMVHLAPGLGLAPHVIIDQHFRHRDRLGRLLTALSYNPGPLGLGIDEDTAVAFERRGGRLRVLGSGAVTVVDGSELSFTDSHAVHRYQPIAMLGLRLHVLTEGCRFDLRRRAALPPAVIPVRENEEEEEEGEERAVAAAP